MTSRNFAEALNKLWPRASPLVRNTVANIAMHVFQDNGITTPLLIAHCMAQISHECGAGTIIRENMNYSEKRLLEIFGIGVHSAKVTPTEARSLANHPQLIAERVYGLGNPSKAKGLGNTEPGDGYRFRGNGMLQLTGRANHRRIGQMVGYDLEDNPEQLQDPAVSFQVAVKEFVVLRAAETAKTDNGQNTQGVLTLVTRRINGGRNGLADRAVWLRRWKTELPGIEEPAWTPRGANEEGHKSVLGSKILQTAIGAAASAGVGTGAKVAQNGNVEKEETSIGDVANKIQETSSRISDVVTTVTTTKDNLSAVVETARPVLGVSSNVWGHIATGAICITLVLIGVVIYHRIQKWKVEGV